MAETKNTPEAPFTVTVGGKIAAEGIRSHGRAMGEVTRLQHKYPGFKVEAFDRNGRSVGSGEIKKGAEAPG
jgi:hypothetical protein